MVPRPLSPSHPRWSCDETVSHKVSILETLSVANCPLHMSSLIEDDQRGPNHIWPSTNKVNSTPEKPRKTQITTHRISKINSETQDQISKSKFSPKTLSEKIRESSVRPYEVKSMSLARLEGRPQNINNLAGQEIDRSQNLKRASPGAEKNHAKQIASIPSLPNVLIKSDKRPSGE